MKRGEKTTWKLESNDGEEGKEGYKKSENELVGVNRVELEKYLESKEEESWVVLVGSKRQNWTESVVCEKESWNKSSEERVRFDRKQRRKYEDEEEEEKKP